MLFQYTPFRIAYSLFAVVFTACVLNYYSGYLQQFISIRYSFWFELMMVLGQLVFQSLILWHKPFSVKVRYCLQLLTVSLLGSLLLLLFIGLRQWVVWNAYVALGYFLCVVVFMFLEHKRRVALLKLPWFLSYTWLLYRSLILIFIL